MAFSASENCHEGGDSFVKLCVEECDPADVDDCKKAKKFNKNKGKQEHEIKECQITEDAIYEAGMRWGEAWLSKSPNCICSSDIILRAEATDGLQKYNKKTEQPYFVAI